MKSTPPSASIQSAVPRAATAFVACYHGTGNALLHQQTGRFQTGKRTSVFSTTAIHLLCLISVTVMAICGAVLGAVAAVYLLIRRPRQVNAAPTAIRAHVTPPAETTAPSKRSARLPSEPPSDVHSVPQTTPQEA